MAGHRRRRRRRRMVRRTATRGATWQRGAHRADVTITGPAGSLLLAMTRRLPLTDPEATRINIDGDADLAQHWLDNTAHVTN
ncbi:hypothetical protein [Kribbella sp. NPDC006257]|uniref:hypothetical protein n=1 Tax=Kribbella sp. NPDC006257 TaxID=3156738 RepID=UPI0033B30DA7